MLDPVWTHGHPALLQPHHPSTALLSNLVDSRLGLAFQPIHDLEMSPCGEMIIAAPATARQQLELPVHTYCQEKDSCTQLVWEKLRLKMVRHETKLPPWSRFALHPVAGCHPHFAMATKFGDVLIVDGEHTGNAMRWSFKELYNPPDHKEGGRYGAKNRD